MTRIETVTVVYQRPRVLLAMKKKRFGIGKFNGLGGKIEDGETIEQAAIREGQEEAGITLINPVRVGRILFKFQDGEQDHLVHFLRAEQFSGTPEETDEMRPEWFHENEIPYNNMWADDRYWLPLLLAGKKFTGNFIFDMNRDISSYQLKEVAQL